VSGPESIAPVLARISQIQSRLGGAGDAAAGIAGVDTGSGSFASILAGTGPGGVVTSASLPSSWSIPWAAGAKPASPRALTERSTLPSLAAAVPAAASASSLGSTAPAGTSVRWPVRGTITQKFGPTTCTLEPAATVNGHHYAHYHDGLDIAAAQGTPVRSMAAGTVEYAGRYPDGAEVVRVRHGDGSVALYAHLQPGLEVKAGDKVKAGQALGRVGMTGNTTGPHLHLELTVHGRNIDPLPVLRSGRLPGDATVAGSGWTAASPLAAADGELTPSSLAAFDAVASSIPYHAEIRDAAVRAGVDPLLLASLVRAESGFRPTAVSSAGAQGLCQLMPATAKSLGVKDPFDPVQNLRAGARYFAHNLELYGRTDLALAAYQAGKGAVAKAGGVPDSTTTHNYIDRICSYWTHYREAAA
jgi:biotin carboxyl carrier protein